MSTLRVNTIQNSGGTGSPAINGLAAAWVNFNGVGTVAIRASNNVSSITDNNTGDYTVNFITALPDANYSVVANTMYPAVSHGVASAGDVITTTQVSVATFRNNAITTKADMSLVTVAVFR
jgi:hypothetical protein